MKSTLLLLLLLLALSGSADGHSANDDFFGGVLYNDSTDVTTESILMNHFVGRLPTNNDQAAYKNSQARTEYADNLVKALFAKMLKATRENRADVLESLLKEKFIFKGCKWWFNKQEMAQVILRVSTAIPYPYYYPYTLGAVEDYGETIEFICYLGTEKRPLWTAKFVLDNKDKLVKEGHVIGGCGRKHFVELASEDSAQVVVKEFVERMKATIRSRNFQLIGQLFEDDYSFKTCDKVHKKQEIVEFLASIPEQAQFAITVESVKDTGNYINYSVPVTGFGESATQAVFTLNKVSKKLVSGFIKGCQKNHWILS